MNSPQAEDAPLTDAQKLDVVRDLLQSRRLDPEEAQDVLTAWSLFDWTLPDLRRELNALAMRRSLRDAPLPPALRRDLCALSDSWQPDLLDCAPGGWTQDRDEALALNAESVQTRREIRELRETDGWFKVAVRVLLLGIACAVLAIWRNEQ